MGGGGAWGSLGVGSAVPWVGAGLRALGHGERRDDAGELAELGRDGVALLLELRDLGPGPLERPAGAVAELVGLGAALGDERDGLLARTATVLGRVGPAAGDLLGDERAQAGCTALGLGPATFEPLDRPLGLVGRVGDDPGGIGLGLLEGGPGLGLPLGRRAGRRPG